MRQLKLDKFNFKNSVPYGGELRKKSKGRGSRPISTKKSMHLVLRSSQARGDWSFRTIRNSKIIDETLTRLAKKYGVKIYDFANSGNHLHLVIRLGNRYTYAAFIRALTGILALKITGASKFKKLLKRFWDFRPFSRVVEWGRAYDLIKDYMLLNRYEAEGVFEYRVTRLRNVILRPYS